MYTKPVGDIVRKHHMIPHSYADDTQGYLVIKQSDPWADISAGIANCMTDISSWMDSNSLKLNQEKFEYIIFHPKRQHFQPLEYSLTLSGSTFYPAGQVRNLGVVQDSCLVMEKQISAVTKSCYYQLRLIGRIRCYITADACKSLVQALVISRLDYANSLLHGIPQSQTDRLQ